MKKYFVERYVFLPKSIKTVMTTKKFRTDGKLGLMIKSYSNNIYSTEAKGKLVNEIPIYCNPAPDETIKRMQKGIIHLLNLMGNPIKQSKELFKN